VIDRLGVVSVGVVCVFLVGLAPGVQAQVPEDALRAASLPSNPYLPPTCVPGVPFADIQCTTGFDAWIEQFGLDGITAGCGGGNYCPEAAVTRDQMAVFVEKAVRGTANWSPGDLGAANTGLGAGALRNNSDFAWNNTAIGFRALYTQSYDFGQSGSPTANTAVGWMALSFNQPDASVTKGTQNTAVGAGALENNTSGYFNTALGYFAGSTSATGWGNTFVGQAADVESDLINNATAIGFGAVVDASNKVVIGNTDVTVIGGQVNWTAFSDLRGKKDVADLDLGLDFVMALRPVSYQLKNGNGRTDMGFVAQDIEALLGDGYNILSIGGDADRTLALRYTDLIAPLVKAVQEQQATIQALEKRLAALEARLTGAGH